MWGRTRAWEGTWLGERGELGCCVRGPSPQGLVVEYSGLEDSLGGSELTESTFPELAFPCL